MKLKSFAVAAVVALSPAMVAAEPLKVGATATGVPFTFLDVSSNQIQGMMVDLVNAVGEKAGFEPQVNAIDFSALIPSLTSERIDIISAAMLITEPRDEVIDFSDPIYPYGEGWAVNSEFEGGISADFRELEGKVVGVQQGTTYLDRLQKLDVFGELRVYDSLADILAEVDRGRIAAGMGDGPILSYQLSQDRYENSKLADYESQYTGHIAMGVRENDEALLTRINEALAALKEEGRIEEIAAKWGLQ